MKKIYLLLSVLFVGLSYAQDKSQPLVILDSKKIGFMNEAQPILEPINPNDISTISVYKGETSQKYGSESGVVIITTKKYILDTFYKNNIENSSLKKEIPTTEMLAKIGVIGSKADGKNLPYDELIKYIDTNTVNDTILKIASIAFIKPADAQKTNPEWKFGALKITPLEAK